jgi:hypothetical protein
VKQRPISRYLVCAREHHSTHARFRMGRMMKVMASINVTCACYEEGAPIPLKTARWSQKNAVHATVRVLSNMLLYAAYAKIIQSAWVYAMSNHPDHDSCCSRSRRSL